VTFRRAIQLTTLVALAAGFLAVAAEPAGAASPTATHVSINHTTIHLGSTAVISGSVSPNLHGHVVYLQQHSSTGWHSTTKYALNSASKYSFTVKPSLSTKYTYRVYDPPTVSGRASSVSKTLTLTVEKAAASCTPGYSPCIAPGSDVDCAGGSGNGPRYVHGPIRVTGSDPYGLDSDHDGIGCET
jgi:hypothetical protein